MQTGHLHTSPIAMTYLQTVHPIAITTKYETLFKKITEKPSKNVNTSSSCP